MNNFFGQNLRFIRKKNGETLESLALGLKISKSAISDYETGKSLPSLEVSEKISIFFKISIDTLKNVQLSALDSNGFQKLSEDFLINSNKDDYSEKINQLEFLNKMLNQKLEGLDLQFKLINQVLQSKDAELSSLKIQLKLLEEKYEFKS